MNARKLFASVAAAATLLAGAGAAVALKSRNTLVES